MTRRNVWMLAATAGLAAVASAADPAPPPRPAAPNLATALADPPAKLVAPTGPLPPPTPAQVEAARAQAAGFAQQFPQAFPRGDLGPPAVAALPVPVRPGPPLGTWARTAGPVKTTLKLTADALAIAVARPAAGGGVHTVRLTADYALSHDGGTLFGLISQADADAPPAADPTPKNLADLEGATFATGFRVLDGELLVGKFRVSPAGPDGVTACVSGRYKLVEAPPPAAFLPPAASPPPPVPAALGGSVGMELGAMLGDAAGRPRAGAVLGAAVGAAVGTAVGQKAGDDTARSLLQQLESAAGWLGVGAGPDPGPPTVQVVPVGPPPAGRRP